MRDATLVTTQEQLDAAVFRMQGAARLAIDTEFMRERTYYAQLCLVQIATDADCFLVDPLVGLDLEPLHALFGDRGKIKILHAARQDLEVLQVAGGRVPAPVFDTQVAAALLGFPPQAGYAELVARQLGHSIDKGQTRTDWSRRPLTPEQLAYAADDVHHLLQLHAELATALEARGRAAWLAEETAAIEDPALYRTEPSVAWRRLKGLSRLRPREQAAARALAEWREQRAIASDKPRGWILSDEALYALATQAPQTQEQLEQIRALPPALARKRGDELLALIAAAREAADDTLVESATRRPTPEETALVAKLQQRVRAEAAALEISPEVLATRRDVEALVFQDRGESALSRGWRRVVIGDALAAMLG
jgi:ribonuclease D